MDDFFVNAVTGDFHLVEGAPVIDQGTTLASVPDDYDGVRRPQGSAYDIGAFERVVASLGWVRRVTLVD